MSRYSDPELRARLERAVARLEEKITPRTGMLETARLNGKVQGVKLALSYIAEADRSEATS